MVFEYVLKQNGLDPAEDLTINQSVDFGSTAAAFSEPQIIPWNLSLRPLLLKKKETAM